MRYDERVGLASDIRTLARIADSGVLSAKSEVGIRSPFAGDLSRIVVPDLLSLFGITDAECITRDQAMSIPGVFRARAILLSLIANKPLQAWRKDELVPEQPGFLYKTPGILGPRQRMARTLDDLIFYPYSLWLTTRGAAPTEGGRRPIVSAIHCPYESWQVNEVGLIEVKNRDGGWDVADDDEVLLIPGYSEGLIAYATRTFRGVANMEQAWVARARNPSPITELHLTDDTQLDDEETIATRDAWANARRAENGAVAVTPANIEVKDHGQADAALFVEGRNAGRIDLASFFNMPGSVLDASSATASLTYVTQEGNRSSLDDMTIPYWTGPIVDRLSQDDVLPAGQSTRFDFSTRAERAIVTED